MELDFTKICRVCINEADFLMPIFRVHISKKMMTCASVQVWEKDGLPNHICNKCVAKLHISYQFKKQCEASDAKLRQYLIDVSIQQHQIAVKQLPPPSQNNFEFVECTPVIEMDATEQRYNTNSVPTAVSTTDAPALTQINYEVKPALNDIPNGDYSLQPTEQSYSGYMQQMATNVAPGQILATLLQQEQTLETSLPPSQSIQPSPALKEDISDDTEDNTTNLDQQQQPEQCPICGKEFATGAKVRRHMKTHITTTLHKCEYCQKTFSQGSNLKKHLLIHSNERPFCCTECNKRFRHAQDLEKHKRTHTGERPYACSLCPRAFSSSSNLSAHMRTHTGERPYVCCVCQKAFCQSNELTKHMRTHTGEKSHTCNLCHKGFNGSGALIIHMRSHTGERPYVCNKCGKGFARSGCLAVHMKRHIGEKNFQCDICDRAFVTSTDLKGHALTHTGDKYDCSMCDKSFSRSSRLNKHVKKTHPTS